MGRIKNHHGFMRKLFKKLLPTKRSWKMMSNSTKVGLVASWVTILTPIGTSIYFLVPIIINSLITKEQPFFSTDKFKVLILPFRQYGCEGNRDCGEIVRNRLLTLNERDTLNIEVKYLPLEDQELRILTIDGVKQLQNKLKADLIIFGSYYTQDCLTESDDQVCFNYISDNELKLPIDNINIDDESQLANLLDIKSGKLQGDIDFIIYWISGRSFLDQSNYYGANKKFLYIENNITKTSFEVYFYLSLISSYLSDHNGALQYINKAIELNPRIAEAYTNKGTINTKLGYLKDAMADYNKAIVLNPFESMAFFDRGLLKYDLGDINSALSDFDKAISLNPAYATAHNSRGFCKEELGDKTGALSDFNKAIELNPNCAPAINNRGLIKKELGDKKGAMEDFNKAIEVNSDYANAYYNRGFLKNDLGDKKEALTDYNKVIEINPCFAAAYFNRGIIEIEFGNKTLGCKDFQKANELGLEIPDNIKNNVCKDYIFSKK